MYDTENQNGFQKGGSADCIFTLKVRIGILWEYNSDVHNDYEMVQVALVDYQKACDNVKIEVIRNFYKEKLATTGK